MTPVFNDQIGVVATADYGLYSGSFTTDDVSTYRLVNGEAYVNKIQNIFNGTYYTPVRQQPNGTVGFSDAQFYQTATNGIQFPPDMDESAVTVYDDRLIYIDTYNYAKQTTVPTSTLKLNEYNGQWSGGLEAGFTFNMPLVEHSYLCGDCKNTTVA